MTVEQTLTLRKNDQSGLFEIHNFQGLLYEVDSGKTVGGFCDRIINMLDLPSEFTLTILYILNGAVVDNKDIPRYQIDVVGEEGGMVAHLNLAQSTGSSKVRMLDVVLVEQHHITMLFNILPGLVQGSNQAILSLVFDETIKQVNTASKASYGT